MKKKNIEKEEKEVEQNRILEKTKFILGEEGHISEQIRFVSVRVEKEVKEEMVYLEQFFRQHYLSLEKL